MARLITASETAYNTSPIEAADYITSPNANKPFSLQDNKLDGAYHVMGEEYASALFNDGNSYISLGNKAAFDITQNITLECWVRVAELSANNMQIFTKEGQYKLVVISTGYVRAIVKTSANGWVGLDSTVLIPIGTWVHIAMTYDSVTGIQTLYQNGVSVATVTKTGPILSNTNTLCIGTQDPVLGIYNVGFLGSVREARLWNITRTQSQIQDGMGTPLVGTETGLVGYWKLISNALDSTANANNGTLSGTVRWNIDMQVGWWGTTLSNVSGVISSSPTLTVTETRSVWDITVIGDSTLNEYPVDFKAELYNGTTLLYTHTVTGNSLLSYYAPLTQIYEVTKIVYTFTKVNKANRTIKIVEAQPSFTRTSQDSLNISLSETILLSTLLHSQDTINISEPDNPYVIAQLISNDQLGVQLIEKSTTTNMYTASNADARQILGKVVITYTDPFLDESIQYTATENGRYTFTNELSDSIETPQYKLFSLHNNVLDGTFHPLPQNASEGSVGWWGTQFSGIGGVLATPIVITLNFSSRALTGLKLVGDPILNEYPVDFVIRIYDVANTLLYTETVVGNTLVNWGKAISSIFGVVKMSVTITKINKAGTVAKLTEFYTAIKEEYDLEMIESVHVLEEIGYVSGGLPIGNVSANEVDIVLTNHDRRFDLNNQNSILYGFVKRNRRVEVFFGAYIGEILEWQKYGTYWTTSWDMSRASLVATLVARDRLELLRLTNFNTSQVYVNKTLLWLFQLVLTDAGLKTSDYFLDAALATVTIPYAWFPKQSHREALQYLAQMGLIQVYCDKEGAINVNLFWDTTATVMATFDDDVNVFSSKYPLAVSEQVNYVEVTSKQWAVGTVEALYDADISFTLTPGQVLTKTFEFDQVPAYVLDPIPVVLVGGTNVTTTPGTLYAWGIDITFNNTDTVSHTITHVTINGKRLKSTGSQVAVVQDTNLIHEDGLIKQSIVHDFIQDTNYAQTLANAILSNYGSSRYDVVLDHVGIVPLRLRDQVLVLDAHDNVKVPYMITRQNISWDGFFSVVTEAKRYQAP